MVNKSIEIFQHQKMVDTKSKIYKAALVKTNSHRFAAQKSCPFNEISHLQRLYGTPLMFYPQLLGTTEHIC